MTHEEAKEMYDENPRNFIMSLTRYNWKEAIDLYEIDVQNDIESFEELPTYAFWQIFDTNEAWIGDHTDVEEIIVPAAIDVAYIDHRARYKP